MKSILLILGLVLSIYSSAQSFESFTDADGLPSNNVLCISSDNAGKTWFGTQAGIAIYDGTTWEIMNTTSHPGLAHNNVSSILVASNGDVWSGGDFGASHYNGTTWTTYKAADGLGSSRITNISEMENGDIWLSDFNGATHYDGTTFTAYKSADGLPFGGVEDVVEADNGNIIMATGLGGIAVFDGTSFTLVTESAGLVSNNTTALLKDKDGNIWVGTGSGVSVFDGELNWLTNHTRMYIMPAPDTLNPVENLAMDSDGNVWVGVYVDYLVTVGGIAKFSDESWTDYDNTDGIVGPTIRDIAIDQNDNIWVATSAGVTQISSGAASLELIAKDETKAFPNPANDVLNVKLSSEDANSKVSLINRMGTEVYGNRTPAHSQLKIDVSSLTSGIYTLVIGDRYTRVMVE